MSDQAKILLSVAILMTLVGILCCSCSYVNQKMGQKDDWLGEELLEAGIKVETGLDVDLTPDSPEK